MNDNQIAIIRFLLSTVLAIAIIIVIATSGKKEKATGNGLDYETAMKIGHNFKNRMDFDKAGDEVTKATIFLTDSTIFLQADMTRLHRLYGYEAPTSESDSIFLLSIFTSDVEDNPYALKLGAYYETIEMNGLRLKYQGTEGDFIKANAIDTAGLVTPLYFKKKWFLFEN